MFSDTFVAAISIALNFWICTVRGQGDCTTRDFDIAFVYFKVTPGKFLENPIQIRIGNTLEVMSHTEIPTNNEKYLSFSYDADTVQASTTNEFMNFERDQIKTELIALVRLKCANGRETVMLVTFEFEDVNNFAPEFSQPSYEIAIPLPLPPDVDIFVLISDRISARDNDLQNNQITFTSDISYQPFRVETSSETGALGKEFFAQILTTGRILNIIESYYFDDIEFTVIATDAGTVEQKSTSAKVKLISKPEYDGLTEIPIFQKTLYYGSLDFRKTPSLSIEPISLLPESFIPSIEFVTELNDAKYFLLQRTNLDNKINLILRDDVTENDLNGQTSLSFAVHAIRPDGFRANTAVLINLIREEPVRLGFEKAVYTGMINSDMTVNHDPIKLADATLDVEFSIKNDLLRWFDVVYNPNVNDVQIQLKRPLSAEELAGKTFVPFTLIATTSDDTVLQEEANVVLDIERAEEYQLSFENTFYEGFISTDLTITGLDELKLTSTNIGIVEYVLSDHSDLFEPVETTEGVQIIKTVLTPDDVNGKKYLYFAVIATSIDGVTGSAVVMLTVERVELVRPLFEKETYTGYLGRPFSPDSFYLQNVLLNTYTENVVFRLSGEDTDLIKKDVELLNGVVLRLADGTTSDNVGTRTILSVKVLAILTESIIGSASILIHVDEIEVYVDCVVHQNVYLIVAIIVLAAIMLIARIISSLLWWKFVRPHTCVKRGSPTQPIECRIETGIPAQNSSEL